MKINPNILILIGLTLLFGGVIFGVAWSVMGLGW